MSVAYEPKPGFLNDSTMSGNAVGFRRGLFADDPLSTRTLRFKGLCASQAAISSKASHVALVAVLDKAGTLGLLVLNPATAEVENDVTELVTKFSLAQVYRFQISANGTRLAVASRESFVVIDLPSRKILLEQDEHYTSLSPQGDVIAFLDKREKFVVTTITYGSRRSIRDRWWNPVGDGSCID